MIIGFTGTSNGMTQQQKRSVKKLLRELKPSEFHHGDCVGADEQAHKFVLRFGSIKTIVHPPLNEKARAFVHKKYGASEVLEPKEYLERNKDIVTACDTLVATPKGSQPRKEIRSGTWATIREGVKQGKKIRIVLPDGDVVDEIWLE